MEITAALFVAIAPLPLAAPDSSKALFTDALTEAVTMPPAEPSAWALINPLVVQQDDTTMRSEASEASEQPEDSAQTLWIPLLSPPVAPRPPLQLGLPSKELTESVKKLPVESVTACVGDRLQLAEQKAEPSPDPARVVQKALESHKQTPQSSAPAPQHLAFTATIMKPHVAPEIKDAAPPVAHLRRPITLTSVPEPRPNKPASDDEHPIPERPLPFTQTWQVAETQKLNDSTRIESSKALTAVPEQAETTSAEPVRQVSVDVEGVEGQLRIRIAERAGEMRAWVTGHTPATVEKVQAGLSDLTRALTSAGFDAEVWAPHTVSAPVSASGVQTSTDQSDRNLFGESQADSGHNPRGGSEDNRRSASEDDDDEHSFQSHMRIS